MDNQTFNVRIVSPKQVVYQGTALSVSSTNSAGKFDILALHANFVTLIENQPITIRTADKKTLVFNFPLAIVYTAQNLVSIYINIRIQSINQPGANQAPATPSAGTPTH